MGPGIVATNYLQTSYDHFFEGGEISLFNKDPIRLAIGH
jgi:hypothetical protein